MLNVLLYEHLEKHWIFECQWSAFFQQCTLGVLFLVSNSEALERIKAICEENDVRETQGKTDGGPNLGWSFAHGSWLEVQHGHHK